MSYWFDRLCQTWKSALGDVYGLNFTTEFDKTVPNLYLPHDIIEEHDDEHKNSCQGSSRRQGMTKTQHSKQLHDFERFSACRIILCYIFKWSIVSEPARFELIYMTIQVSVTSRERQDASQESSDLVLKPRRVAMRKIQRLTQRLSFLYTFRG